MLQRAGYYQSAGMPKVEVARKVSEHMVLARNTSASFQVFAQGVRAMAAARDD